MTSKEPLLNEELRIVLIGRVGAGKTAVMKTLLMCAGENENECSEFKIHMSSECQKVNVQTDRYKVVIVDTPGLCQPDTTDEKEKEVVVEKIKKYVSLVAPDVFLLVMDLERFTKQEELMVELIWKTFGKGASKHTMVLFTHGNDLKRNGTTIEAFIEGTKELQTFVDKCNGGYHVIDNKNQDPSDAEELLQKIEDLFDKNGRKSYTCNEGELDEHGEKDNTSKETGIKKKIEYAVKGTALVGAGIGAATTYFTGSTIGIKIGAAAGAAVFAVLGCLAIPAYEHFKLCMRKCVKQ